MTVCFDFILVYFNAVCQSGFSLVEFENKGQFSLGDFLSKVTWTQLVFSVEL